MAGDRFELVTIIPAAPEAVYLAWLDGAGHARMTGAPATGSPAVGGRFTAWDGYIEGENLELEPARRILQSWRTSEFPEDAPHSRLEVLLVAEDGGTRLVLRHSEIPEGQGKSYESGWVEHYFEPMQKHFGQGRTKATARRKAVKSAKPAKAKKAASAKGAKSAKRAKGGAKKKASAPARKGAGNAKRRR